MSTSKECTCYEGADECTGDSAIFYPLQDGGEVSVRSCKDTSIGCYQGCYYYTDSCFRKDCHKTNDNSRS